MAIFESIPDLNQFSYEVLDEYGIAQESISVLKYMAIASTTDDERLSLACLVLVRLAITKGINGLSSQQAHASLQTITEPILEKHPFVRWHLTQVIGGESLEP